MKRELAKIKPDHGSPINAPLEVIAGLLEQDLSVAEISRRTGLSDCRVRRIASDRGVARPADRVGAPLRPRPALVLAFVRDYTGRHSARPRCGRSRRAVA